MDTSQPEGTSLFVGAFRRVYIRRQSAMSQVVNQITNKDCRTVVAWGNGDFAYNSEGTRSTKPDVEEGSAPQMQHVCCGRARHKCPMQCLPYLNASTTLWHVSASVRCVLDWCMLSVPCLSRHQDLPCHDHDWHVQPTQTPVC